jgi:hypothetical protein
MNPTVQYFCCGLVTGTAAAVTNNIGCSSLIAADISSALLKSEGFLDWQSRALFRGQVYALNRIAKDPTYTKAIDKISRALFKLDEDGKYLDHFLHMVNVNENTGEVLEGILGEHQGRFEPIGRDAAIAEFEAGRPVLTFHEMDEELFEVTSLEMIAGYSEFFRGL